MTTQELHCITDKVFFVFFCTTVPKPYKNDVSTKQIGRLILTAFHVQNFCICFYYFSLLSFFPKLPDEHLSDISSCHYGQIRYQPCPAFIIEVIKKYFTWHVIPCIEKPGSEQAAAESHTAAVSLAALIIWLLFSRSFTPRRPMGPADFLTLTKLPFKICIGHRIEWMARNSI